MGDGRWESGSTSGNALRASSLDGFVVLRPDSLYVAGRDLHWRAANYSRRVAERTTDLHSAFADREFANRLVMPRAAHLEHRQPALHLAEHLDVAQEDDGVGEGRDVRFGDRVAAHQRASRRRKHSRDLVMLDERRQSDHELAEGLEGADILERGQTVERDALRLELGDYLLDRDEPILET